MKRIVLLGILLLLVAPMSHSIAQDGDEEACEVLIEEALQLVGSACIDMGRNEACYGHNAIDVTLQADVNTPFADSGDLIGIDALESLDTQAANPEAGTWGIAFMALQADLPDDTEENVTMVLLGDVSLSRDDTGEESATQAFTFESGQTEMCAGAPDGLLIHSPEGTRARLMVNGVELAMSSTIYLKAIADDQMILRGVEGQIDVSADGQTETITGGLQTTVPLDGLAADGGPTPPEPIPPGEEFPINIQETLFSPAQASGGSGGGGEIPLSVWMVSDLEPNSFFTPQEVVVVSLDDGDTLLIIWDGIDIVYTRQADGTYSGTELVAGGGYDFSVTLEVIDDNTMQSNSTTQAGTFTSEASLLYERIDGSLSLYVEGEREIIEFSQFQECLGRTGGTVGSAWTRPDLLVPMQITDSMLMWNQLTFEGGGGVYVNEHIEEFGTFENVITQTFTSAGDGNFDFSYHAIADGRDDCEMIYNSSYSPFDGDFEAIFARAADLSEAEE